MTKSARNGRSVVNRSACWCGLSEWQARFRTARFGLVQCQSCSTYRIDPPPVTSDVEAGEFYTEYYRSACAAWDGARGTGRRTYRFWRVCESVPGLALPGRRALDYGCGDGDLCADLTDEGWEEVYGFDVSQTRLRRARETYPRVRFLAGLGADFAGTMDAASCDLAVMDNVIEHLPSPLKTLVALKALLARRGRLVLITPNMWSGNFRLLGKRWTPELSPHAHIFLFTPRAIGELVERAGYVVVARGTFHTPAIRPAMFVRRLFRGELKWAAWRLLQEAGGFYARLLKSGPMLYVVAERNDDPSGQ